MPLITRFRGIDIIINWDDHAPPHFHAIYNGQEMTIEINNLNKRKGKMPRKQLNLILQWANLHIDELRENWELAKKNKQTNKIEPLK